MSLSTIVQQASKYCITMVLRGKHDEDPPVYMRSLPFLSDVNFFTLSTFEAFESPHGDIRIHKATVAYTPQQIVSYKFWLNPDYNEDFALNLDYGLQYDAEYILK